VPNDCRRNRTLDPAIPEWTDCREDVLGVEGSPSCGVSNQGILVEELQSVLEGNGISIPFFEVGYEMTDELLTL
jgi:hypothetical protein